MFLLSSEFPAILQTLRKFSIPLVHFSFGIRARIGNVILTELQVSVCLFILSFRGAEYPKLLPRRYMSAAHNFLVSKLFTARVCAWSNRILYPYGAYKIQVPAVRTADNFHGTVLRNRDFGLLS